MNAAVRSGDVVVIEWSVKQSLLGYLARSESFGWTLDGGAAFDPATGATIPAVVAEGGAIVATGSVRLSAHDGALVVPLVAVRIAEGVLTVDDPVEPGRRMPLVALTPVPAEQGLRWTTALSHEADVLFLHNYLPGAAFDELIVRPA